MKRTLKRELKVREIVKREAIETSAVSFGISMKSIELLFRNLKLILFYNKDNFKFS